MVDYSKQPIRSLQHKTRNFFTKYLTFSNVHNFGAKCKHTAEIYRYAKNTLGFLRRNIIILIQKNLKNLLKKTIS